MRILLAAAISEGLLLVAALAIIGLWHISAPWNATWRAASLGIVLTAPPLIINHLLWRYSSTHPDSIYGRFSREIVTPLCRQMNITISLVVALLSGICEELFFRGALNYLCIEHLGAAAACILTSVLFAAMHFIGNFRRYGGMMPLYIAMGAYLWTVHAYTQSLAAVAILHGFYNFLVISMVRHNVLTEHRASFANRLTNSD